MLEEIFYTKCIGCGFESENRMPICEDCIEDIEEHPYECESCGYPSGTPAKICGYCKSAVHRDRVKITYKYQGLIRQLIKQIKFDYRISGLNILENLVNTEELRGYDIITDVPSHYTRNIRRLTHPATDIARHIALTTDTKYLKVMKRVKRTEYQYKLRSHMRRRNVHNAFICIKNVKDLKVLIVDDIITTGSTTEECAKVMKKAGASVVDVFALTGGRS